MASPSTVEVASCLLLPLMASLAGCAVPGERAATGGCPTGQACSAEAPAGLLFGGPGFSDTVDYAPPANALPHVAEGGHMTLSLVDAAYGSAYVTPFDAKSGSTFVFDVGVVSPPDVEILGAHHGRDELRILSKTDGTLLDQVAVNVDAVASADLFPLEMLLSGQKDFVILAGGSVGLVVRLSSATGVRLVDERVELEFSDAARDPHGWDLFHATGPGADTEATVRVGGNQLTRTLHAAPAADDIVVDDLYTSILSGLTPKGSGQVCFSALSKGVVAVGAAWQFTASGSISVDPTFSSAAFPSCVVLLGNAPGSGALRVDAGGVTKTFPIPVSASPGFLKPPSSPPSSSTRWVSGERFDLSIR